MIHKTYKEEIEETICGISIKEYHSIHYWLRKNYGKANKCENPYCLCISNIFEWAKIPNKNYKKDRTCFEMLCRSCHTKQDVTNVTREKLRKFNTGKKLSQEHRQKISKSNKGNIISKSARKKLSIALSGEKSSLSKLTNEQVLEIRKLFKNKDMNKATLARVFNVGWWNIHCIITNKTWKHL